MKNKFKLGLPALCLALLLPVLPTMADEGKNESKEKDRKEWEKRDKDERKGESERRRKEAREHYAYFHEHGYTNLRVPEGHLPPPGECRVWYPGKPPGQQPPPVKCASAQVPPGAWLMRRPRDDRKHVNVHVYDQRSPGVVISVGIFMAETGAFIRYVSP